MSTLFKVVITVPNTHADHVRKAAALAGGGQIGAYTHCSFTTQGTGRFCPNENAHPHIGKAHKLEEVTEERIEINCPKALLKPVVEAIRKAHPYEEPVIDIYQLLDIETL